MAPLKKVIKGNVEIPLKWFLCLMIRLLFMEDRYVYLESSHVIFHYDSYQSHSFLIDIAVVFNRHFLEGRFHTCITKLFKGTHTS